MLIQGFLTLLTSLSTATGAPPEKVLFLGSSSIANWSTLKEDFPTLQTVQAGVGGTTYADLVQSAAGKVQSEKPQKVVLYSGDNDLANGMRPEQVLELLKQTLAKIDAAQPTLPICVLAVKPSPGRAKLMGLVQKTNALFRKELAAHKNVHFVDVFPAMLDGKGRIRENLFDPADETHIHMNREGYRVWALLLKPCLQGAALKIK